MFFIHKTIKSAVKKVEFISDRLSYLILRGRWYDIIVTNVHAPIEDKDDLIKIPFMGNWNILLINFPDITRKYY